MTGTDPRVPWRRSLFPRVFGVGAVIALIAVAAATWATVRSTTVAVQEERRESLHADARTYDELVGYAATHADWSGAGDLLAALAAEHGQRIVVTDPAGRPLADSGGASDGSPAAYDVGRARASLDPLAVDRALIATARTPVEDLPDDEREQLTTPFVPGPAEATVEPCGDAAGCAGHTVAAPLVVDPRTGLDPDAPSGADGGSLRARVDTCLADAGLAPTLALTADLVARVPYDDQDRVVAGCVEEATRTSLDGRVAPPALLLVGDGSTATVFWDLSSGSRLRIAAAAAGVLGATLLLCALLAGTLVRPLRRMGVVAQRAGAGDLGARMAERRRDEIGEVARAFNTMAERRERLEEARRRMMSDVSHELRTPLANVRGWLEAAQDGVAATDADLVASLHEEALQLQHLVDDLHDLALGDAGELRLDLVSVDLGPFLDQVAASFRGAADARCTVLVVDAEPGAQVVADPVRLRQAVGNVVANALRHTESGRVTLRGGAGGHIVVSDTGEGIAADEVPHVFDRFRRADASRTRRTGGSGLGLAIVRQIVEAHGGSVDLTSTEGVGTTVTLVVPGGHAVES